MQSFDRLRRDFAEIQDERQKGVDRAFARWQDHQASHKPKG
jgi:hypothetical protein